MEKTAFILAVLAGIIFSNVCCTVQNDTLQKPETQMVMPTSASSYGAYLAGRMAHIRHDLNTAADYYILAAEKTPAKQMLPSQLYIMLTSQGRVDEAVKYADQALANKDTSPFIYTVKAVYHAKKRLYDEALKDIAACDNDFSREVFAPLISAWIYAGQNNYEKAVKSLDRLLKNEGFRAMYLFHAGAISDYLGKNDEADKYYSLLEGMRKMELSVFPTQVIANFYLRTGNQQKLARTIALSGNENNVIMKKIVADIQKSDSSVPPILTDASVGISDALFGIALILQQESSAEEIAMLFASLADYINPQSDLPKILLGSILESKELYEEANQVYNKMTPEQYSYYSARFQIGKNNISLERYQAAENIFRELLKLHQPTPDIYTNLGEVMRLTGRFKDAAIYYGKALEYYPENQQRKMWPILFTQGIAYDEMGEHDKAEEIFRKVHKMHPSKTTKNHLGYTLLKNNKNIEEAFELIAQAYKYGPKDGSIVDSMGWALYHIGRYDEAIVYLEKASDLSPSEALIYDHLGDAYWEAGRKGEAIFQWNHAVSLKDHSGEIDKDAVLQKIENGKSPHQPLTYDKEAIEKILAHVKKPQKNQSDF